MADLNPNNVSAIIGVIGSLAGVILGFILNGLNRIGKIKLFQNSLNTSLKCDGEVYATYKEIFSYSENPKILRIELNIDFFNSSKISKRIARDIIFYIQKKSKKKSK